MALADLFDDKEIHNNDTAPSKTKKEFMDFCIAHNGKIVNDSEHHLKCSFEEPLDVAVIEIDNDDNTLDIYVTKSRSKNIVVSKLNKIILPKEFYASMLKKFGDDEEIEEVSIDAYHNIHTIEGKLLIKEISIKRNILEDGTDVIIN